MLVTKMEHDGITRARLNRYMGRCRNVRMCFPANNVMTLMQLVARLFLAVYLVAFLSLSGLVYAERWSQGAHVTPEMWAEHTQLMHLGYANHHGGDEVAHVAHEQDVMTTKQMLPFVPMWSALPQVPFALEWTSYVDGFSAILLAALIIVRLLFIRTDARYKEYLPPTPHRPPIIVS